MLAHGACSFVLTHFAAGDGEKAIMLQKISADRQCKGHIMHTTASTVMVADLHMSSAVEDVSHPLI